MTSTILDPNRVPFGVDSHGDWLDLRFSGIENPHILICGGSQTGKTTLQILIAAIAASRGNIVLVLDPKLRFARAFRDPRTGELLPNVFVFWDSDPDAAARAWQGVLDLLVAEMQRRYQADAESSTSIIGDTQRFPRILLVADELGTLLDFADREWLDRKPDDWKGACPTRNHLHTLTRMGAEAGIIGCFANQTAAEKEMPAGTRTRTLCGQRVFLGPVREGQQWRMLAGEGVAPPEIPDGQKGAGAVIYSDGKPLRFQAALLDAQNKPELSRNLAAQGVPILRESGYIDDRGRLLLAGVPVPAPAKMAYHVTGSRIDLLQGADTDPAPTLDPPAAPVQPVQNAPEIVDEQPEDEIPPNVRVIVGLKEAADFCGLSVPNFRKIRELFPIDGEMPKYRGNQAGWQEPDLKMWAQRHAANRTRRDEDTGKGAA